MLWPALNLRTVSTLRATGRPEDPTPQRRRDGGGGCGRGPPSGRPGEMARLYSTAACVSNLFTSMRVQYARK